MLYDQHIFFLHIHACGISEILKGFRAPSLPYYHLYDWRANVKTLGFNDFLEDFFQYRCPSLVFNQFVSY